MTDYSTHSWADGDLLSAALLTALDQAHQAYIDAQDAAVRAHADALGTPDPTPSTVVRRDTTGWVGFNGVYGLSSPQNAADAANKGYVDALGTANSTAPDSIVRRNINGWMGANGIYGLVSPPTTWSDAANKGYVDGALGGMTLVKITQAAYDALPIPRDPNKLFVVVG